jgi:hypothetical protein
MLDFFFFYVCGFLLPQLPLQCKASAGFDGVLRSVFTPGEYQLRIYQLSHITFSYVCLSAIDLLNFWINSWSILRLLVVFLILAE